MLEEFALQKEIFFYFVSKREISRLHDQFFSDPTPTDCITFPMGDGDILGEVFICPEVALEYAKKAKLDLYTEISLYAVHGFLHLVGFRDLKSLDKKKMRLAEKRCLKLLKGKGALIKK